MYKLFALLSIAVATAAVTTPTFASDQTDVMRTVHQFVDGFNKGDTKSALAACADDASIIDEFPPHEWHGVGACSKWLGDFVADMTKKAISDGFVTLHTPRHVEVTADRAYVVAPVDYAFKMKGKRVKEAGSTITLALQKTAAGWRITGWAWAKR